MNSRNYTKVFSTIITSSVWDEDSDTKVVWVTMLALQDQHHEVHASVPGLARMAKVSRPACEKALACFLAPDRDSRTKTEEGRRIVEIEGGWKIINGQKYRNLMSADERREYKRVHEAKRREKLKERGQSVDNGGQPVDSGGQKSAETETETETELRKRESHGASLSPLALVKEVFDAWNESADNVRLPKCLQVSDKRRRSIEQRSRNEFFVTNWRAALVRIGESDFCCGINPRGWRATFEWFISPDAVQKIMEGKYDNRSKTNRTNNPRNIGVSQNNAVNNYGELAKRRLEREMAKAENQDTPKTEGNGA